jgi:chromatin segregation and condensation protein Rec8/ScpA/Scc1 (kleisin family)
LEFKILFETKIKSILFDCDKKESKEYYDNYNQLFESLDKYNETITTSITAIKETSMKPTIKHVDRISHIEHKEHFSERKKPSKYVVKNTSKYEPKEIKKETSSYPKYKITM